MNHKALASIVSGRCLQAVGDIRCRHQAASDNVLAWRRHQVVPSPKRPKSCDLTDLRMRHPNTCSQFDGKPGWQCRQHRVGKTPCRYSNLSRACRRDKRLQLECDDDSCRFRRGMIHADEDNAVGLCMHLIGARPVHCEAFRNFLTIDPVANFTKLSRHAARDGTPDATLSRHPILVHPIKQAREMLRWWAWLNERDNKHDAELIQWQHLSRRVRQSNDPLAFPSASLDKA